MEGYSRKDEGCPKLLDLIPKHQKWVAKKDEETSTEDKKLELSLGPPGTITDHHHYNNSIREKTHDSNLNFGYFKNNPCVKNHVLGSPWLVTVMKEASQPCGNRDGVAEKKAFSPAPANTAHKRTAPAPVVGWPPIRSFRKNLSSGTSSKPLSESQNPSKISPQKPDENSQKTLFVKINMDGIPIGRKVDLKAYDSYEKLSYAVDELFRGLLAAQSDSCAGGFKDTNGGGKTIEGLLDGSGEYTLVYEDNEGDRMLVGDVPWHMFVSTVKRLRVLKSSELPSLSRGSKQGKLSLDA